MSESRELIANQRTREPARDERLSKRLAERVGVRLLARGGQRYADAVIEGLGDPSKAWMTCHECKRPYVQEWAVREMGHAMNRAMGHPSVQVQVMALIERELGSLDRARLAVSALGQVEHLGEEALAEYGLAQLRAYYEPLGKRVLVMEAIEPGERGGSHGPCDDPGSANGHAKDGANGSQNS